jgi:hypothetical protein
MHVHTAALRKHRPPAIAGAIAGAPHGTNGEV